MGSVCRSDEHFHYLVQNNGIEPKFICVNFDELENKLKEALVELSSGQSIIKFLQKQINTTLVLGSQHNLRYEMPLLYKEVLNQKPISMHPSKLKWMDPNQLKSLYETKGDTQNLRISWSGNMIISNHFESFSNFNATINGNR